MTAARNSTRDRLLSAGADLFDGVRPDDLLPSVRAVCRRAGLPTGSFYHCFVGASEFHAALMQELVRTTEPIARASPSRVPGGEERLHGSAIGSLVASEAGRRYAVALLERQRVVQSVQKLGVIASRHEEVGSAARRAYLDQTSPIDDEQQQLLSEMVAELGRSIRSPFNASTVVAVLTAVADGLVLRSDLDPRCDTITLMEDAVRVVFAALLRRRDDLRDIDDILTEIFD